MRFFLCERNYAFLAVSSPLPRCGPDLRFNTARLPPARPWMIRVLGSQAIFLVQSTVAFLRSLPEPSVLTTEEAPQTDRVVLVRPNPFAHLTGLLPRHVLLLIDAFFLRLWSERWSDVAQLFTLHP